MTELQFRENTDKLLRDITKMFYDNVNALIDSNMIDISDYQNDSVFPRTFICAFGQNIHDQYMPWKHPSDTHRELIHDIYMEI